VIFSSVPTNEIDECIDVSDTYAGFMGTVCFKDLPWEACYWRDIGPYDACGAYQVTNTASFITNDTGTTGDDSWTVVVKIPCKGCTRTIGYWKTHSKYGPAPYDDTWGGREDRPCYDSGKTWYEILWTPPRGNPYFILAKQFVGVRLNWLAGADPSAVEEAVNEAATLLDDYTPDEADALKGQAKKEWTDLAGILDDYNNGRIGPGHCDEFNGRTPSEAPDPEVPDEKKEAPIEEEVEPVVIPTEYTLNQNYPNPFNPSTTISFSIPRNTEVTLAIYNLSGQKITTLLQGFLNAGQYDIQWSVPGDLPSGVYVYRLETAEFVANRQMLYMK
jgi:hypothetical protein